MLCRVYAAVCISVHGCSGGAVEKLGGAGKIQYVRMRGK